MIAEVIRNGCNVLRLSVSMFLKSIFKGRQGREVSETKSG
jgi:hypothetical protein